jgi:hypothetical protein
LIKQLIRSSNNSSDHQNPNAIAPTTHRGDLELWLQYLDYCEQIGAAKAHSRALAQALQIFPRQVCWWVYREDRGPLS